LLTLSNNNFQQRCCLFFLTLWLGRSIDTVRLFLSEFPLLPGIRLPFGYIDIVQCTFKDIIEVLQGFRLLSYLGVPNQATMTIELNALARELKSDLQKLSHGSRDRQSADRIHRNGGFQLAGGKCGGWCMMLRPSSCFLGSINDSIKSKVVHKVEVDSYGEDIRLCCWPNRPVKLPRNLPRRGGQVIGQPPVAQPRCQSGGGQATKIACMSPTKSMMPNVLTANPRHGSQSTGRPGIIRKEASLQFGSGGTWKSLRCT
jgi:hypothetical protein